MKKLILRNFQSPGDLVMLSGAVRDLHECYPGQFITDVRTSCSAIWENNPHITPLDGGGPDVETIDCHSPLIHQSNTAPYHFVHAFGAYLNEKLGLQIRPTSFQGDIHISDVEKAWFSQVEGTRGECSPFWLLVSGGKYDYTIKWWDHER